MSDHFLDSFVGFWEKDYYILSVFHTLGNRDVVTMICLHMNQKAHVTYNFNILIEIEDFRRSQAVMYT